MTAKCQTAALPVVQVPVKKGEKILWHPWAPHGGSVVRDPKRTRRSIAGHYVPRGFQVSNVDVFFGLKPAPADCSYSYLPVGRRAFVAHGDAHFADSYI
jgi:ectoine hydroxylase-related dioxygenase (phytanoyl-CoA dioxygenase family)